MLAHIHPSRPWFDHGLVPASETTGISALCLSGVSEPPSAQSPLACNGCYPLQGGVERHLEAHYRSFFAHTGSCARPRPSHRLQFPSPMGLCRLSPVPAGRWPFPTLSLRVFPWMPGSVPRWPVRCSCPVLPSQHRPSPRGVNRSACHNIPPSDFIAGESFAVVIISYVQASRFACHPGHSHRCS